MKRHFLIVLSSLMAVFILAAFSVPQASAAGNRVIVVFDESSTDADRRGVVLSNGGTIVRELSIVPAIVIHLPE